MIQLIEVYNDLVQRFEGWVFKYCIPPFLKFLLFGLKIALFWSFYMMVKNTINEAF
tara:strand:- start:670 stop:837 length:168 start_codon:yes stop_codon:yes gene_type:complete